MQSVRQRNADGRDRLSKLWQAANWCRQTRWSLPAAADVGGRAGCGRASHLQLDQVPGAAGEPHRFTSLGNLSFPMTGANLAEQAAGFLVLKTEVSPRHRERSEAIQLATESKNGLFLAK
jgi:hypothetical protein